MPPMDAPSIKGDGFNADYDSPHNIKLVGNYKFTRRYSTSLYDGQRQSDGSYLYYTAHIHGLQTMLVSGFDAEQRQLPMQVQSSYVAVLPRQLPRLTIHCTHEALRQRAMAARRQALLNKQLDADTLQRVTEFLSQEPDRLYDLDEWTQMNSVRELLLEFVKGIKRQKRDAIS